MIELDNDDDCAIPEDKIDVNHDDPSKMGKGPVQDWTDVEQVMVVPRCVSTIKCQIVENYNIFRRKEFKKGENFKTLYIWGRFPFNIW